jgi:hypothetical protein
MFKPDPLAGPKVYSATITITFDNGKGLVSKFTTTINAIGQGWDMTVTSKFSGVASSASAGSFVTLPVTLSVDKHGLINTPLSLLNIKKIQLVFSYNQNILHIDPSPANVAAAITFPVNPTSNWSLDPANPSTLAAGVLTVNLINTSNVLTDADTLRPIAYVTFKAVLPQKGDTTQMQLTSANFTDNLNQTLSTCTAVAKKDSDFTLIYRCGDSTIQGYMNGKFPLRANPVNPNPAGGTSGNILDFKYSTVTIGNLTLEIFDMLGNSISKIIDNQSMPAGTYEARYNAARLDEGTYIYRYTLDNKNVISGRFVIQK